MSHCGPLPTGLLKLPPGTGDEGNTTVIIVQSPRGRRRSTPTAAPSRRTPRSSRDDCASADPRNFLLSGGHRARDCERAAAAAQAAQAAVRGMRSANAALSGQLQRARLDGEREAGCLRGDLAALSGRFRAEQERLAGLRERLAEECRVRGELEAAHQERVRDVHKRLQAEHLLRVNAELEASRAAGRAGTAEAQLRALEAATEGARREAAELRRGRLEAEAECNQGRAQQAALQAELEAARTAAAQERHVQEVQQRKCCKLEASLKSQTGKASELQEGLRGAQAAAEAAGRARDAAEASAARQCQELVAAQEGLEAARRGREEAARLTRQLQEQAHYDDLKAEQDKTCRQLAECRAELARARSDARSSAELLDSQSRQAARVPALAAELGQTQGDLKEVKDLLLQTQAAFKLMMETLREKEAAAAELEAQADGLLARAESMRAARDEKEVALQEKEHELGCLRHELAAGREEAAGWHQRCAQLQAEADERELEVARRDLQCKELGDAVHLLSSRTAEEAAAAANDHHSLKAVIKSLEGRLAQVQAELARTRDGLGSAEQGHVTALAELETAQQHCSQLRAQLNEEQTRASRLRGELACLSGSHIKDQKEKSGLLSDTVARLQAEEGARLSAQHEAKALRRRVEELEASLGDAAAGQARADEAYKSSQAALEAMRKKLEAYKRENKSLMCSYDQWLQSVVAGRQPVVAASP